MDSTQQPSVFAQVIDKLRGKSEEELKTIYLQLFANDLADEWKNITEEANLKNVTEEEIIQAIQKKRYQRYNV